MTSKQVAQEIDAAHKAYRDAEGTALEAIAYAYLVAVVARIKAKERGK